MPQLSPQNHRRVWWRSRSRRLIIKHRPKLTTVRSPAHAGGRKDLNAALTSVLKSAGCSQAA